MKKITRGIATLFLCATLTATFVAVPPVTGSTGQVLTDLPALAEAASGGDEVVGTGWLDKLACIGCMAGIGFVSGGTVVGFLAVATIFPEGVVACAMGCYLAYKE
ncbi:MAG: hypothetical protein F4164_11420 [Gemmatimonadales bacterium]|nr:hypothetical protein [Gemmatimonadales bacterium]MYG49942.1 hypothetical protein [Gemmatimonadales bacterium]MYK01403.1 hypothetical protein [Candidatus Palauibacter ramosifaciens]